MNLYFVSTPFSDDPERRIRMAREAVAALFRENPDVIYFSPILYFPQFMDDSDPAQREKAFDYIYEILELCDGAIFVCDTEDYDLSPGMQREFNHLRDCSERISAYDDTLEFITFAHLGVE